MKYFPFPVPIYRLFYIKMPELKPVYISGVTGHTDQPEMYD